MHSIIYNESHIILYTIVLLASSIMILIMIRSYSGIPSARQQHLTRSPRHMPPRIPPPPPPLAVLVGASLLLLLVLLAGGGGDGAASASASASAFAFAFSPPPPLALASVRSRIRFGRGGTGGGRGADPPGPSRPIGAELFDAEYVPSGLTREEYAALRERERREASRMDYGGWGPRFLRGDRPDGDWMVVPSLWTGGFDSNAGGSAPAPASAQGSASPRRPVGTAAALACALALAAAVARALARSQDKSPAALAAAAAGALRLRLRLPPSQLLLLPLPSPLRLRLAAAGWPALASAALASAALLLPLSGVVGWMADRANRRWLWSQRRARLAMVLAPLVAVAAYALLLSGGTALAGLVGR